MSALVLTKNGVETRKVRLVLRKHGTSKVRVEEERPKEIIRPQVGPQEMFLSTPADIAIYGGAAGGGKSFGLLLEPLRHISKSGFGAVIFRRTYPEITSEGGLWDTSMQLYPKLGAIMRQSDLEWRFPCQEGGWATIGFAHMQHASDMLAWQGSQIPFLGFDELTHFEKQPFFYMLSRLRTACGVEPYVRCTCNPDPDSWVADFIAWWIDQETGFPIAERCGKLRWFVRRADEIVWGDTAEELLPLCGKDQRPLSVTFIAATVDDNQIMLANNPSYKSNLHALPHVDMMRLLKGNWKVRRRQGDYFKREWFEIIPREKVPAIQRSVRYWDRAATVVTPTSPDPDWTVGVKLGQCGPTYYVLDVARDRLTPAGVLQLIKDVAESERETPQIFEQDPGQAGKSEVHHLQAGLPGIATFSQPVSKAKVMRALPASTASEKGLIKIVEGPWNKAFIDELEAFCDEKDLESWQVAPHDDQVDGFSGAYNSLTRSGDPRVRRLA